MNVGACKTFFSVSRRMLFGHADGLSEHRSPRDQLLADPESLEDDFKLDSSETILYAASFEELARDNLQYDTIIWVSISLLLVLAWGVGIIMLLYLPFRRYVLQKDISSRKLYVTPSEIVYEVSRPSFIPFWGTITIEKHVPLSKVIDIIIEQGTCSALVRYLISCIITFLFYVVGNFVSEITCVLLFSQPGGKEQ
ncbi:12S seed storage globulin 1 [Gossypium australe]|uniref:12S seed storage globulin 1 n=1 Tax=Gossypium australe TaxID=47621 RepID=A0A5B6W279_9ROSI|nr:12S seed storage globulin 1 [Gossypium australe]